MFLVSRASIRIANKWWVTLAVTLGMLMSIMDSTIVNVAIPTMRSVFGADIRDVQWVVTIYMLTRLPSSQPPIPIGSVTSSNTGTIGKPPAR